MAKKWVCFGNEEISIMLIAFEYAYDEERYFSGIDELEGAVVDKSYTNILEALKDFQDCLDRDFESVELTILTKHKKEGIRVIRITISENGETTICLSIDLDDINKELSKKIDKIKEIISNL